MPQSYNASVKWTATLTNRLLAQAGLGLYTQQYREIYREELPTAPGGHIPQRSRMELATIRITPTSTTTTNLFRGAFRGRQRLPHLRREELHRQPVVRDRFAFAEGRDAVAAGHQPRSRSTARRHRVRFSNGLPNSAVICARRRKTRSRKSPTWDCSSTRSGRSAASRSAAACVTTTSTAYAPEQWSPPGTWVPARLTPPRREHPELA